MRGYGELQADVFEWLSRPDATAYFVGIWTELFEAKASRILRTRGQETAFTGTIGAGNTIALPADWVGFKTLWIDGEEGAPLLPQTLESVIASNATTGVPAHYAVDGANVRFDGVGDVIGVYYARVPGLETNTSNWLSVQAYDAYLFGVLAEAWDYYMDDAQAAKYEAKRDRVLAEVAATDQRDKFSGPLVARKR